jgi:NADH:ubiquinone oxidoreductase subunit 2 (subunit N)
MIAVLGKFRKSLDLAADRPEIGLAVHEQQQKLSEALVPSTEDSAKEERAFFARFAVLNLIGLALVAAAWAQGLLTKPYEADSSGMSYLITALFVCGLVCALRRDWQSVRWAGNALVYLGMVGTILGLIITVSDLSADKAQSFESFKAVVTSIYVGSGVALYTNLLACIFYLWLGTNAHLLARQEV